MINQNWEYSYKYNSYKDLKEIELDPLEPQNIYSTYKYKNKRENPLITKIVIKKGDKRKNVCELKKYFFKIKIFFSHFGKILELYQNMKNIFENVFIKVYNGYLVLSKEKWGGDNEDFFNVMNYLEELDEIKPLKMLNNQLFVERILEIDGDFYACPEILKNIRNPNIQKIKFEQISQKDKEYHDKLINSLTLEDKFVVLKKYRKTQFEYNYNLLKNEINDNLDINKINDLVKMIEYLSKYNDDYDKIYNSTNIYYQYLNHLSTPDILNKLNIEKITNNRAFEIINYLYNQNDLSFKENIQLVKIINNKFPDKDLILIKNKILCKLITNNTNLDNDVFKELEKYEDIVEGIINLLLLIKNNKFKM